MVNLLHKKYCGDLMKQILKFITPLLIVAILFSSCSTSNSNKPLERIKTLISENELNSCLQLVKDLETEEKVAINNEVCNIVINKFIELRDKTKIDETNIFDLSLIDTSFAEKCQKLWNIISEFTIDNNYELYYECINLRYYSEMIDYTRYCDIYTLVKKANNSGYLDDISTALYEYENNGDKSKFVTVAKKIENIDYNNFDPQQYLVSDFRTAHEKLTNNLTNLIESFNTNNSASVATAINTIRDALTDILFVTDTLAAVNTVQKSIYHKISTENIYAPFNNEIQVTKRDYTTGMSFALNIIFGGFEDVIESTTDDITNDTTNETTTKQTTEESSLNNAIKIALNAINKTKNFKGNVEITLTETEDVKLTDFKSDSSITDVDSIVETQINQELKKSNGTTKTTYKFYNGKNNGETLTTFIPPNNKNATLSSDAVTNHNCVEGSGGYVVTLVLNSELIEYGSKENHIGSIVNTFSMNNSEDVKDFDTAYSKTNITIVVNNDGRLIELEYTISGISNCIFEDENTQNKYNTQLTFKNTYKYEFKY